MARPPLPVDQISKAAIRKRAQRAMPLNGATCSQCGSPTLLERHHDDYNKPVDVRVLCSHCHALEHKELQPVNCAICKTPFQPKRGRRSTLCGKAECLAALGKLSAQKRWRTAATASDKSATASSPSAAQSHLSSLLGEREFSE